MPRSAEEILAQADELAARNILWVGMALYAADAA